MTDTPPPLSPIPHQRSTQQVEVSGHDNTTVVAWGDVYYIQVGSGLNHFLGSVGSIGRDEYLQALYRSSAARRQQRRSGATLTAQQVDRSLAVPVNLPAQLSDFPAGQVRALIGPLGSGKSDIAEQWHRETIDHALRDPSSRVPVWVDTKYLDGLLGDRIVSHTGLAALRDYGADVVVDGLDERSDQAAGISEQAIQFVAQWPKSRVLLTSRAGDTITESQQVKVSPLTSGEAEQLMRVVAGHAVGPLNDQLAEAVQRPLFALLVARHATDPSGVTGLPELIDRVVDKVVGDLGYDLFPHWQKLAVETIRTGKPVDPARFTTTDIAVRIRASPLVTSDGRRCAFSLATFEQWFAAKALLEGITDIEEALGSLQMFDRWKYVLALVLASGEPTRADPLLAAVARWNPGALAWLIRESRTGGLTHPHPAFGPEDWETIGHRLREAAIAMLEGLGPLAKATFPVQAGGASDLNGISLAVAVHEPRLTLAWLVSDEVPSEPLPPVTTLPLASAYGERSVYLRTEPVTTGVNWVWEVMQRHLAEDLNKGLGRLIDTVATQVPGVVRDEYLDMARQRFAPPAWADESSTDALPAMYPPPDVPGDFSNPWGTYTPDRIKQRVQQIAEAALSCYRQLCENLAPHFGDTLGHRALMPVQFFGNISYHPNADRGPFAFPGPPEPSLKWLLKPTGAIHPDGRRIGTDSVSLTLNDPQRSQEIEDEKDTLSSAHYTYFETQPAIQPYAPSFVMYGGRFDLLGVRPATTLALMLLWKDLKKLQWVTDSNPPRLT
ncbi:hypothetical protein [Nocardia paucivorans]|uniref:hypothetical protein n=1 Tax=Nocardia paucivorans TaxID=114259 RepID=UPI000306A5D3|nr:hypothetical protein [Nocardia paucivorans]